MIQVRHKDEPKILMAIGLQIKNKIIILEKSLVGNKL